MQVVVVHRCLAHGWQTVGRVGTHPCYNSGQAGANASHAGRCLWLPLIELQETSSKQGRDPRANSDIFGLARPGHDGFVRGIDYV